MGYSLGIDLGTTFTAAALARDGRVEVVPLGNHAATIPTMVFLRDDDTTLVGDAAERRGLQEPARLAREFKRRLGDSTPIMLDRTPFSADRLMAVVLRQIVADVTQRQGSGPDRVAITHPANWGQYKIDLLLQAVQLSGLSHATFVSEPVAAAVEYAATERMNVGELVGVYDLGGGTFDAAVLRKTADGFETLGRPQGIERLGGIDFDEAVFTHVRNTVGGAIAALDTSDPATRAALARLRQECVSAKETLSSDSDATVPVLLPNLQTQVRITRVEFEDMIRPILRETVETMRRAVNEAGVAIGDLKAVLLAGGSSRIPLVGELVRSELGRPVVTDAHPKHSVAMGAARLAAGLTNGASAAPGTVLAAAVPSAPPPPAPTPAPPTVVPPPVAPPHTIAAPAVPPPAKKNKSLVIALAAVGVIAVGVIAAAVLSGGGDDDEAATTTEAAVTTLPTDTTTAATEGESTPSTGDSTVGTTNPPADSTTTTSTPQSCSSAAGLCAGINNVEWVGDTLFVNYNVFGFDPVISNDESTYHVHFFFDTIPPEEAGVPGSGPWVIWDRSLGEGELIFDDFNRSNFEAYQGDLATQVCVAVAFSDHRIDTETAFCSPLPNV